jgi:hypothetical protein
VKLKQFSSGLVVMVFDSTIGAVDTVDRSSSKSHVGSDLLQDIA